MEEKKEILKRTFNIYLDDNIIQRAQKLADKEERSINWILVRAIRDHRWFR